MNKGIYKNYYNFQGRRNRTKKIIMTVIIIAVAAVIFFALVGILSKDGSGPAANAVTENTQLKLQISEQQETINKLQLEIDRLNQEIENRDMALTAAWALIPTEPPMTYAPATIAPDVPLANAPMQF